MEKAQELIKEGKLSKTLMADKKFVEGAKKILKDGNIEMDDKKLAELMDQIETNIKNSNEVSDDTLANVAGGASYKENAKWVARKAVIGGSMIACGVIGNNLSADAAEAADARLGDAVTEKGSFRDYTHYEYAARNLVHDSTKLVGTGGGAWVGFKLGQYIADNMGLEEGNQSVKS